MNADQLKQLENDLWNAADILRANSGLKSNEYATLLDLPESADIARAIKAAMEAMEQYVPFLAGTLPTKEYFAIGKSAGGLKRLLQNFSNIPADAQGDLFGQIYELTLRRQAFPVFSPACTTE